MVERKEESSAQEYNALVASLRAKVSRAIEMFGGSTSSRVGDFDKVLNIPSSENPRLKVRRDKNRSLIEVELRKEEGSSRIFRLVEERKMFGKSRLKYYEEARETTKEGSIVSIPVCSGAQPSIGELKSFNRILDYVFVKPELKTIGSSEIVFPDKENANKVIKHLENLGFEMCGGTIHAQSKGEICYVDSLEDLTGRIVTVEKYDDRTVIEMGTDLATHLAGSGFSA